MPIFICIHQKIYRFVASKHLIMVNLEWYRTFKAIYQNGTLTKAAQELMISQPNVSIQLASLESYIGKPLFVRLPRKMVPTEDGKRLYTQIVESIDNLERVEAECKRSTLNKAPTIRLGTPAELFNTYLAERIGGLDLSLRVSYGLADELIQQLKDNDIDIALITRKGKGEDSLVYEPLTTETLMVVCSSDTDTTEFDSYIASGNISKIEMWLKTQKWYVYSNDLALLRRFWRENFKKRPIIGIQSVIPDYNAIIKAVANSSALTTASDLIAGKALKEGMVKILWQGNVPATNTIYFAYNKDRLAHKYIEQVKVFVNSCLELKQ